MKFIKENWQYILIFFLIAILTYFFPNTGRDWYWGNINNFKNVSDIWKSSNGNILSSIVVFAITNFKFLKVLAFSILTLCLFLTMKGIVNKNNNTILCISLFLFLLIDLNIWKISYVNSTGFSVYFLGTLMMFILIKFLSKNKINSLNYFVLLLLGLACSLVAPIFTVITFITSLIFLIQKIIKKEKADSYLMLFLGSTLGLTSMMLAVHANKEFILIPKISYNLLHKVVPMFINVNFLVILITIAFLLFLSIKIFLKGNLLKKIKTAFSMTFLAVYAIVSLFSKNDILNYISYCLFTISSIYILINLNNSKSFKTKISLYYYFKILYILCMMFFIEYSSAMLLFPFMIDILIILELINYSLPMNFLKNTWYIIVVLFLLVDIYVYKNINFKNKEMNTYIKRELSCLNYNIELASKYENEYLHNYLPITFEDKFYYLKYYDIEDVNYFDVRFNN